MGIISSSIPFSPELRYSFPVHICANCASKDTISVRQQSTKLFSSYVLFRTTATFKLEIPTCQRCLRTLNRRPRTLLEHVVFIIICLLLIVIFISAVKSMLGIDSHFMDQYLGEISAAVGLLVIPLVYYLKRPRAPKTSNWQPVRIKSYHRERIGGPVGKIRFVFTNEIYRQAFCETNATVIRAGRVDALASTSLLDRLG